MPRVRGLNAILNWRMNQRRKTLDTLTKTTRFGFRTVMDNGVIQSEEQSSGSSEYYTQLFMKVMVTSTSVPSRLSRVSTTSLFLVNSIIFISFRVPKTIRLLLIS